MKTFYLSANGVGKKPRVGFQVFRNEQDQGERDQQSNGLPGLPRMSSYSPSKLAPRCSNVSQIGPLRTSTAGAVVNGLNATIARNPIAPAGLSHGQENARGVLNNLSKIEPSPSRTHNVLRLWQSFPLSFLARWSGLEGIMY